MDEESLAEAILQMDRRKIEDEVSHDARSALDVASGIGTDTPLIILRDVRKCIMDVENLLRQRLEQNAVAEIRAEERHRELIATLQNLSISTSTPSGILTPSFSRLSMGGKSMEIKQEYYHVGDAVKTGFNILGLILLQIDAVASNCPYIPNVGASDGVIMDLKKWSSAVSTVYACESLITPMKKVTLPRLSDSQVKTALSKCATTESGRSVVFRTEELAFVCDSCSDLMSVVDEIKLRIIKCPGLISEEKRLRLAYVDSPATDRDSSLKVTSVPQHRCSPVITAILSTLSFNAKKQYAKMILENKKHPLRAAQECRPD